MKKTDLDDNERECRDMEDISKITSPFSCKEYSKLCSCRRDRPLSFWEKISHRFHHLCCFTCRRFSSQLDLLDKACRRISDSDDTVGGPADSVKLSNEAKSRIERELQKERY